MIFPFISPGVKILLGANLIFIPSTLVCIVTLAEHYSTATKYIFTWKQLPNQYDWKEYIEKLEKTPKGKWSPKELNFI